METIIICFECRKRATVEEIRAGKHDHADFMERENPFDPAAVGDE